MRNYSVLPTALLPQMENDGNITEVELDSDKGVVINVDEYTSAEHGDYLGLYWDGILCATLQIDSPATYAWPWIVTIAQAGAPDGPHQVWYTVTDAAQNPSASPVTTAIVDRAHSTGLLPPTFPDADNNQVITYDSVVQNSGTYVHVPWSDGAFNAGDTVYVYWRELDSMGTAVANSNTSVMHSVIASDLNVGFDVLIASSFVSAVKTTGVAQAWYSVIPNTGVAQSSQTGEVNIDMSGTGTYPAPIIPAGIDGWIDCSEITIAGIEIDIPANTQFVVNASVDVCWQGYISSGSPVPGTYYVSTRVLDQNDVTAGFSITVPVSFITPIGIGYAQAWYEVKTLSPAGISARAMSQVDAEHCVLLPAPVFPAASDDNTISGDEVVEDNGTDMFVTWTGMALGDIVTAYWFAYRTTPDSPLPLTRWMETRTLTQNEAQLQQAEFHIPAENITPVGNGYGEGKYQVNFSSGGIASSDTKEVIVSTNSTSGLQMNCTTGAPIFDQNILVRPLNTALLTGPAGAEIEISLPTDSSAFFYPSGSKILSLSLDSSGSAIAEVYSFSVGNVTLNAYVSDSPDQNVTKEMLFTDWLYGEGDLAYYGMSNGAMAGGKQVCSVYVKTSDSSLFPLAKLALTTPTSAIIPISGTTTAILDMGNHYCGEFDVTDVSGQTVDFTLSLVGSSFYITDSLLFLAASLINSDEIPSKRSFVCPSRA
ncbi:hypothetical protein [Rahnella sikkimica]|uniref:Uncharacterized protein n=1 Tax=Rahnella sikkimica TaxID=1805933 RepID=A0A2L1UP07_9GAMM|nr:hypothetical protein [Rahnella sikkimica]AVF34655.1 hypothetical protein BV494_06795 [Rahnella sikkimica]